MRQHNWIVAVALLICAAQAYAKVELNLSEPKAAARTFIKALAQGDMETAKAACIATEKQQKWVELFSFLMTSFGELDKALTDKFGKPSPEEENLEIFAAMREEAVLAELATMRVQVDGDTAKLLPVKREDQADAPRPMDLTMSLRRVDGQWKVDVASLGDMETDDSQQMKKFATMLHALAQEVKNGKYKSRAEVTQAIMTAAMGEENVPATQPGTDDNPMH